MWKVNDFSEYFEPVPDNTVVWRYMCLEHFKDLVLNERSYFCRIDKFNDPLEGAVPLKTKERIIEAGNKIYEKNAGAGEAFLKGTPVIEHSAKKCHFTNCWHMNENESADMWKGKDIVIKSNFKRLKNSFKSDEKIYKGAVKYIDHNTYEKVSGHIFAPALYKSKKYQYEQELRVSIIRSEYHNPIYHILPIRINVITDIKELIDEVYVAQGMEDSQKEIIDKILLNNELNQSKKSVLML